MRRTFFTLLACALFSFYANTASADQVQQDVLDILSQSKPDVPYLLDMSKKPQYDFVVSQLTAAGFTPQNAPQLYQTINNLVVTDAQNPPQQSDDQGAFTSGSAIPIYTFTNAGRTKGSGYNYEATLLSSYPNGTNHTTLTLQLLNAKTAAALGAKSSNTHFADGTDLTVTASGTWPDTPTKDDEVLAFGTVILNPKDSNARPMVIYTKMSATQIPATPPVVKHPVQKPEHASVAYILSCLQRAPNFQNSDCDYGPYNNGSSVQFPMQGSVEYMSAVTTPLTTANSNVKFIVWDDEKGGGCSMGETSTNMLDHFAVNGNTVSWNFDLAKFGTACFNQLQRVDLAFSIAVETAASPGELVPAFVTSKTDGSQFYDTTEIKYLEFAWGCLVSGSKVLMADGTQKAIEDIQVGEMVISNTDRQPRKVIRTIPGTEDGDIFIVTDTLGNSVKMTDNHPVVIKSGEVVLAENLKIGDELMNANGSYVAIQQITKEAYNGKVWNLVLDSEGVQDKKSTNFFAENLMVGDNLMLEYWNELYEQDHRAITERLPKEWLADYNNWRANHEQKTKN